MKRTKQSKLLAVLLAITMVMTSLLPTVVFAEGEFYLTESIAVNDEWGSNYNTESNFIISSKEDLLAFASLVNQETDAKDFQNKTVTLAADIDLSNVNWLPIGQDKDNTNGRTYDGNAFAGTFDGNGYTISNISIEQKGKDFLGLFGGISGATIKNLKIENCSINGKRGQEFFETQGTLYDQSTIEDAGGLIGYVGIGGATISDVTVNKISVYSDRACGSLIGWVAGTLNINGVTCEDINIMGSNDRAAGLIGYIGGSGSYNVNISGVSVQGTIRLSNPTVSSWGAGGLIGMVQMPSVVDTLVIDKTSVSAKIEVSDFYNTSAAINSGGSGFIGDIRCGNIQLKDSTFDGKITVNSNPNISPNLGTASGISMIGNGYKDKATISITGCALLNTEISASNINVFAGSNSATLKNSSANMKLNIGNGNYYVDATKEAIRDNLTFGYKNAYDWTPIPTVEPRTGYNTFAWKDENGDSYTLLKPVVEGHITIFPTWTPNTYTINFDANGGNGTMDSQTATYDTSIKLNENKFSKDGLCFAGWNTDSKADKAIYANGAEVKNLSAEDGATVTLYAIWTERVAQSISYATATVEKHINDGAFTNELTPTTVDGEITYTSSNPAVATVDENGEVTIKGAGTATITATAAETDTHKEAVAAYTLTVTDHSFTNYVSNNDATYFADGTETAACDTVDCDETDTRPAQGSMLVDTTAPTGEIMVKENGWKSFINTITFDIFCKDKYDVTITAEDNETGVKSIEYLLSETEISKDGIALADGWQTYSAFRLENEGKYIIYAKITDNKDNVTYISSDGLVIDKTAPAVSGIEDGKTYCSAVEVTVSDEYLNGVTVNGTAAPVTEGKFTVEPKDGEQTIVVTDKAGNEVSYTITVNNGHTFTNYVSNKDATCTADGTKTAKCDFCDAKDTLTDTDSATSHDFSGEWKSDETNHWHECTACGERSSELAHTFQWVTDKEATETENGSKHEECSVCGCKKAAVEIPATGTGGDNDKPSEPSKPDTDAPQTGDNRNMMLWFALLAVSAAGVGSTLLIPKKRGEHAKTR